MPYFAFLYKVYIIDKVLYVSVTWYTLVIIFAKVYLGPFLLAFRSKDILILPFTQFISTERIRPHISCIVTKTL